MNLRLQLHKLFLGLFIALSFAASAQTGSISIQGILKNFDGTVVEDGDYEMEFNIYQQASSGTAIWTETQDAANAVTVTGGVYNTVLGKTLQGLTDLQTLAFDAKYYVGITVLSGSNPLEMSPRIEMAYSVKSLHADHAVNADTAAIALMARGVAFETSGISEVGGNLEFSANNGSVTVTTGTNFWVPDTITTGRVQTGTAYVEGDVIAGTYWGSGNVNATDLKATGNVIAGTYWGSGNVNATDLNATNNVNVTEAITAKNITATSNLYAGYFHRTEDNYTTTERNTGDRWQGGIVLKRKVFIWGDSVANNEQHGLGWIPANSTVVRIAGTYAKSSSVDGADVEAYYPLGVVGRGDSGSNLFFVQVNKVSGQVVATNNTGNTTYPVTQLVVIVEYY